MRKFGKVLSAIVPQESSNKKVLNTGWQEMQMGGIFRAYSGTRAVICRLEPALPSSLKAMGEVAAALKTLLWKRLGHCSEEESVLLVQANNTTPAVRRQNVTPDLA